MNLNLLKIKLILVALLLTLIVITPTLPVAIADGENSTIYISGNDMFDLYTTSGNGSSIFPYVISDIGLIDDGEAIIYIENTDAFFIITGLDIIGNSWYGVFLGNVSNGIVEDSVISDSRHGIVLSECRNINVTGNIVISDEIGIMLEMSRRCNIIGNSINAELISLNYRSNYGCTIEDNVFLGGGMSMSVTRYVDSGVRVKNNTVNGRPLGFLFNGHDKIIDGSSYGQAIIVSSTNITVYGGDFQGNYVGVSFLLSQNCEVTTSSITNNHHGVSIYESSNIRVSYSNITNNHHGVVGYYGNGLAITSNVIAYNAGYGLWAQAACSSSVIYNNVFMNNTLGNAKDDGGIQDSAITWVAGRFVNRVSGRPLSNVTVTAKWDDRTWVGHTNLNGILKIAVPQLTTYDLTIENFRYVTKTPSVTISNTGIHLFNVQMDKADLGPGTGYVLARFMDGSTPITGANVKVYSVLDGAYYFHSEYVSAVAPAGWVNITGLYYDDYVFVVTHPDYEERIINQVIIASGHAATYNNIQLVEYPTDAFIYGTVTDAITREPIENANIRMDSDFDSYSVFTGPDGFYNITNIHFGTYSAIVSKSDYVTKYMSYTVDTGGDQDINPFNPSLSPLNYTSPEPLHGTTNNWDNQVIGNYWDDLNGREVYEIQGDNIKTTEDEHPFTSIDDMDLKPPIPEPTVTESPTTSLPTTSEVPTTDPNPIRIVVISATVVIVLGVMGIYLRKRRG